MKKILTLIILALLWSNAGSAEDYKWEISTMNEGQTVLASMNGNVTHGDTLMFTLRNNQGKCDILQENFTFYTMSKNPDIKKIEGKIIPIKSSEGNTYAEASYVLPFMMGHRVFFSTGSYKVDQHIDFLSKYKTYDVTIVNETKSKSAEQSNVIKNFKAADYFDVPNNSWNVKNAKEAILKAQKLCLEYKVTKKNITENNQVTKTYADGSKYVGETKDGTPHGQGTYTSSDGRTYVGGWKNGTTDGQGTSTSADGSKFIGEFKDGKMQGQGVYTFPNGSQYVGEYKKDKRHGQGTFTYPSGDIYVGEWRDDKENGQGTYIRADGKKYVGEFKDGNIVSDNSNKEIKKNITESKQVTITFDSGATYVGEVKNGIMDGQGTYTSSNQKNKYTGEWKDGKREGQGTAIFPNSGVYVGEWKDDKRHGQGIHTVLGGKYVGEFKNDKMHGQATFTTPSGATYAGEWKNNKRYGQITLTYPSGEKYVEEWKDGKSIKRTILSKKIRKTKLNNIIKFTECYEIPKYNNYKSYKNSIDNSHEEWTLEVDIRKNTVTNILIWDDKSMKHFRKKKYNTPRTEISSEPIKVSTSDFVVFNSSPDTEVTLNLKKGQYQVSGTIGPKKTNIFAEMQCKIK